MRGGTIAGYGRQLVAVIAAIAITSAMDASGLGAFSALPLLPLACLCWYLERIPRRELGLVWGHLAQYGLAVLHPVVVMGSIALAAWAAGAVDTWEADWGKASGNFALVGGSTVLVALLTEEGFFRGWLWASLRRAGASPRHRLVWTSVAFALWHVTTVALPGDFALPPARIPVYLLNAALLGAVWGMLRMRSGSVIVASVGHGVWNGAAYVGFGYGTKTGALGIEDTVWYGPEVGLLGLAFNAVFLAWSLRSYPPEQ